MRQLRDIGGAAALLSLLVLAIAPTTALGENLAIHNSDFGIGSTGVMGVQYSGGWSAENGGTGNELEGWTSQAPADELRALAPQEFVDRAGSDNAGCCFNNFGPPVDGAPEDHFGEEQSTSGSPWVFMGNNNPVTMITDTVNWPVGKGSDHGTDYRPNTTYTVSVDAGIPAQGGDIDCVAYDEGNPDNNPEKAGNCLIGMPEEDRLELWYYDEDLADTDEHLREYSIIASATIEEMGFVRDRDGDGVSSDGDAGWRNGLNFSFTTGDDPEAEPWLGKPIAVGFTRAGWHHHGDGGIRGDGFDPHWPGSEWRWQSNVDTFVLNAEAAVLSDCLDGVGCSRSDINMNGDVDFADFVILSTDFGKTSPHAAGGVANIPEPTTLSLLGLGLCLLLGRRRR